MWVEALWWDISKNKRILLYKQQAEHNKNFVVDCRGVKIQNICHKSDVSGSHMTMGSTKMPKLYRWVRCVTRKPIIIKVETQNSCSYL